MTIDCTQISKMQELKVYVPRFDSITCQVGTFKFSQPMPAWLICIENMYVNAQVRIWSVSI